MLVFMMIIPIHGITTKRLVGIPRFPSRYQEMARIGLVHVKKPNRSIILQAKRYTDGKSMFFGQFSPFHRATGARLKLLVGTIVTHRASSNTCLLRFVETFCQRCRRWALALRAARIWRLVGDIVETSVMSSKIMIAITWLLS